MGVTPTKGMGYVGGDPPDYVIVFLMAGSIMYM